MTFLNALLAFGATAFLVPLLIHLLHRSKFQIVEWGAMHFLQSSVKVNSRKFQWQNLLLLLLRCLLPVLLAIAMARPLMQSWMSSASNQPLSIAVIIDDSTSMFAVDKAGVRGKENSRFDEACRRANVMLEDLPRGSDASIVLGGTAPVAIEKSGIAELKDTIRSLEGRTIPSGPFDLSASVQLATQWLAKSTLARRQIVVISDFQSQDWDERTSDGMRRIPELLKAQAVEPELQLMSVLNEGYQKPSNICIASLDYTPSLIARGQSVTISATVRNQSETAVDRVPIVFFADETEIQQQTISIPANSSIQVRCQWTSPESNQKPKADVVLRASLSTQDAIEYDNTIRSRIQLIEPISVLLIDGDRRNEAFRSESDYLRLALSPFALMQGSQGDLFISRSIQPHELNEASIDKVDVLALCNVPDVSEQQQSWIRKRVENGMGLVVFAGDRVRIDQYNSWKTVSNSGLRIGELQQRQKTTVAEPAQSPVQTDTNAENTGVRLRTNDISFQPLADLSKLTQSALGSIPFSFINPIKVTESGAIPRVSFENGEPWIIEASIGKGSTLWVMTSCDDGDSVLPTRPVYLPVMQRLFQHVSARRNAIASVEPGELERREWRSDAAGIDGVNSVDVLRPDQQLSPTPLVGSTKGEEKAKILEFSDTRLLGQYTFRLLDTDYAFVVNNQTGSMKGNAERGQDRESELEALGREAIQSRAKVLGAQFVDGPLADLSGLGRLQTGRELWTWIWTALLVCFFAEIALEQQMSPRARWSLSRKLSRKGSDDGRGGVQ